MYNTVLVTYRYMFNLVSNKLTHGRLLRLAWHHGHSHTLGFTLFWGKISLKLWHCSVLLSFTCYWQSRLATSTVLCLLSISCSYPSKELIHGTQQFAREGIWGKVHKVEVLSKSCFFAFIRSYSNDNFLYIICLGDAYERWKYCRFDIRWQKWNWV